MTVAATHNAPAWYDLAGWLTYGTKASADEIDAENGQSIIRFIILGVICTYVTISSLWMTKGQYLEPWALNVLTYYIFFAPAGVVIYYLVRKYPGHYPARRLFSMTLDFGSLTYTIIAGCTVMLPVYALIVWVAVGNGLRFGPRYLAVGSAMAQICLAAIYVLTPYWQDTPIVAATLSLTALLVPLYARKLLDRVERLREAAEEANLSKSRFLAHASHDLRQPVHAIGLFIAGLRETGLDDDQARIVDRIDRSNRGVANLFRSLLDVSMLDSGHLRPNLEVVAMDQFIEDLVAQNRSAAEWAGVDLRHVSTRQFCYTDRVLLMSMVQNLLSNAIKHANGRDVLLGCRRRNGKLDIDVVDRGKGIADEHLPHVFDEFYQVRESGDRDWQGVGLGLSIVARLAHILGLDVEILSIAGKGTTVSITGLTRMEKPQEYQPRPASILTSAPLAGLRILLIEDDRDVLESTHDMLQSWGCHVEARTNVPESCGDADILVTDFDLGDGKTGADAIALFRAHSLPDAPVIVITGHDVRRIEQDLREPNIRIVKKPLKPSELRSVLNSVRIEAGIKSPSAVSNDAIA